MTALDTTNLTLAFTVPANGIVDVDVMVACFVGTTSELLWLGLLNHTGGAQIGNSEEVFFSSNATNVMTLARPRFHLTELTPGALQVDLAAVASSTSGIIIVQGLQGSSGNEGAEALMQAFASI